MIRVGIAEDNPRLRKTLTEALTNMPGVELLFSAKDGKEIIQLCAQASIRPDAILMDIEMPNLDGIGATSVLKRQFPDIRILMLTIFDQHDKIFDAIAAGASGYLLKGETPTRIVRALEDALEDRLPMSPEIARIAVGARIEERKQNLPEDFSLTTREIEILQLLAEAKSYKEIAAQLIISEKTVRNHIHHIYQKIQVSSKAEAIHLAHKNQWFE